MLFDPLLLDLEFARTDQTEDPFAFRFVAQPYVLRREGGRFETVRFDWTPAVLADLQAVRQPDRDPAIVQRVGELLREFLQPTDWPLQEAQCIQALRSGRLVVLTVRSAAAELYALPWELLALRDSGQQLGELPNLLIRYEWPALAAPSHSPASPTEAERILFAWSAAGGAVPAAEQIGAIEAAAERGHVAFDPTADVLPRASLSKLLARLHTARSAKQPIAVLHLLCHGTAIGQTFGLALDDESGVGPAVAVDAGRLRQALSPFADMLRLVVLSACDGGNTGSLGSQLGSIAQTLHRAGIAHVIASRYPLSVAGSIRFAERFYAELLATPSSSERAFLSARTALAQDASQLDWASLQLYARSSDGADSRPIQLRPYRGLLAFQPEHQRFFFGRDREVAEIVADVTSLLTRKQPRLLAVDGASGSGKSSVVFAGALPKLLDTLGAGAVFRRLRPGSQPMQALSAALIDRDTTVPMLLIVDQFEELFTQSTDRSLRRDFARQLFSLAIASESIVVVVLTLRSDFVGHCGELVLNDEGLRLDRILFDEAHRVSIAQMSPQQLRDVIVRPASQVGLQLQAGLVERMLHDVDSEPGALPLLADTLDLLWQRRDGRLLTQAAYDQLGGVAGTLHGRASQLIAALSPAEQKQARRLLVRLGSGLSELTLGIRLRVRLASRRPKDTTAAADFDRMLTQLVQARLLVLDREGTDETVEVAHEALLRKWPLLSQWADEDRQLNADLDAVETWVRLSAQQGTLLSGAQLARAHDLLTHEPDALSEAALTLLERSQHEHQQSEERDRFARDCLRMLAVQALQDDVTRQAAILREAESHDPSAVPLWLPLAIDILQTAILTHAVLTTDRGAILHAAFSPDGQHIAASTSEGVLCLLDVAGGPAVVVAEGIGTARGLDFSSDGRRLLVASSDGNARVYFVTEARSPAVLPGNGSPLVCAVFHPRTAQIATASEDGSVRLWDERGKASIVRGHKGAVRRVAFSPDGLSLVTAGADGVAGVHALDRLADPDLLSGHDAALRSAVFSSTGTHGLTLAEDGSAQIWDAEGRGRRLGKKGQTIRAALFSPDGQRVAVGLASGDVLLSDLQGKTDGVPLLSGDGGVTALAFSSDGTWLAATFAEDHPAACRVAAPFPVYWLCGHLGVATQIVFSPDSRWLVSVSSDGTARSHDLSRPGLYSAVTGLSPRESASFFAAGPGQPSAVSADGNWQVTTVPDGRALLSHRASTQKPRALPGHSGPICGFDVRRDGQRVIVGGQDGRARVYSMQGDGDGALHVLEGHRAALTLAVFSPDGNRILTMSQDGTTRLWNESGRSDVLIDESEERGVAISRDWKYIVTEYETGQRLTWQLELDPQVLRSRLWQATPFCLSVLDRRRYLHETQEQSVRNQRDSQARAGMRNQAPQTGASPELHTTSPGRSGV